MERKYLSPLKSIRRYCLTRCENGPKAVRGCNDEECPNHPYRMAKQPSRAGIGVCDRDTTGRFRRKDTAQAGSLTGNNENKGVDKDKVNLCKPDTNKQEISLASEGIIKVKKSGKTMTIEVTQA